MGKVAINTVSCTSYSRWHMPNLITLVPIVPEILSWKKNQNVLNCEKNIASWQLQVVLYGAELPSHHPHSKMATTWTVRESSEGGRVLHILHLFRQISHCRIVARWGRRRLTKHLKAMEKKKTCNMQHNLHFHIEWERDRERERA